MVTEGSDVAKDQVAAKGHAEAKSRVAVNKADNGKINCFCVDDGFAIFLAIILDYLFPFSLTKYSAIFVEVKGYFGINDN
jgi:hypothetical protein